MSSSLPFLTTDCPALCMLGEPHSLYWPAFPLEFLPLLFHASVDRLIGSSVVPLFRNMGQIYLAVNPSFMGCGLCDFGKVT